MFAVLLTGCDQLKKIVDYPHDAPTEAVATTGQMHDVLTEDLVPCTAQIVEETKAGRRVVPVEPGVQHRAGTYRDGVPHNMRGTSHCIPCSKARTVGEKWTCEGGDKQ